MATEPQIKTAKQRVPNLFDLLYSAAPVVVARSQSLQPLQALCHENDDVVPTLMTMRYRLRSGPVFGTVLATFADDVWALRTNRPDDAHGDVLPVFEPDSIWDRFVAQMDPSGPEHGHGRLTAEWVGMFLSAVGNALPTHQRMLLLCEIEGDPGTMADWERAMGAMRLPRNVTIVVSEAPRGWDGPEVDAPQGASGQEEVFTFREAALSGDQAAEVDRLGVAPLADGLARLIMLPQTRPLTVGVQAPWGWGKSSFVAFVREALVRHAPSNADSASELVELETLDRILGGAVDEEEQASDADIAAKRRTQSERRRELLAELERRAHTDVICVSFNAWRYEGSEQVWAGLARAITAGLEGTLSRTGRWRSRLAYTIWRRKLDFWLGLVVPGLLAVLLAVLAFALGVADAGDELAGWAGGLGGAVATVAAGLLIAWRFMRVVQPVSAQVAGYVTGPDYGAHMGYQNEVIDDLKFLHGRVEGEPRVVVVVDDLDRCSDESIMETLQAINLVLGASDFFVVLAIDTDMIHRAIARQRGLSEDDEAAETFAENYLRKIIQLPVVLPGRSADQRFGFVSQLFSPSAQRDYQREEEDGEPDAEPPPADDGMPTFSFDPALVVPPRVQILREVQDTKEELEALHASRDLLHDNPRELKRLVNVHRLVKILLQRPDAPPTPEQQRKLVAWLVFCAARATEVDEALAKAAGQPDDECVVEVGGECLSAQDLAADGTLARAARISLLVRDRPAATRRQTAAESDPVAPPVASPS